ncbi:glutamate--cysteine ligase [Umezawaea endophytica]|uniref:Putative glutamate--cysteine ligase 2 n=1 Tax=Umezawaea endophytica TaxID=1654476 RepID=A0A9X2VRY6_9PSEU|nr:glutamate--cysteine ligase [Umezawaea endophytica]MCS7481549.1 glutamate--cysteine ligase [Umezawaea endophytica]
MGTTETSQLPRPRTLFDKALTVGVEEEFLLVDAVTRTVAPLAPAVLGTESPYDLQAELTEFQVESATPVCRSMSEVRDSLVATRSALKSMAATHGAKIVATGTPILGDVKPVPLTDDPRYRRMVGEYGKLVQELTICGCHVHVGIPDDDAGVLISNHLRPWLPVLLALSANSPFVDGRDTGYSSWRYLSWSPWPSAGAPPHFASGEEYQQARRGMLDSGAAMDTATVYWDVRLSANHPTVELRVCDVAATVDEAVLIAALTRGVAAMALSSRVPALDVAPHALRAALWRAARDGVEGTNVDLRTGALVRASTQVQELVTWARPALEAAGDYELVTDGVDRVLLDGSGAARQRRAFQRRGELVDVVDLLVEQTAAG